MFSVLCFVGDERSDFHVLVIFVFFLEQFRALTDSQNGFGGLLTGTYVAIVSNEWSRGGGERERERDVRGSRLHKEDNKNWESGGRQRFGGSSTWKKLLRDHAAWPPIRTRPPASAATTTRAMRKICQSARLARWKHSISLSFPSVLVSFFIRGPPPGVVWRMLQSSPRMLCHSRKRKLLLAAAFSILFSLFLPCPSCWKGDTRETSVWLRVCEMPPPNVRRKLPGKSYDDDRCVHDAQIGCYYY